MAKQNDQKKQKGDRCELCGQIDPIATAGVPVKIRVKEKYRDESGKIRYRQRTEEVVKFACNNCYKKLIERK